MKDSVIYHKPSWREKHFIRQVLAGGQEIEPDVRQYRNGSEVSVRQTEGDERQVGSLQVCRTLGKTGINREITNITFNLDGGTGSDFVFKAEYDLIGDCPLNSSHGSVVLRLANDGFEISRNMNRHSMKQVMAALDHAPKGYLPPINVEIAQLQTLTPDYQ